MKAIAAAPRPGHLSRLLPCGTALGRGRLAGEARVSSSCFAPARRSCAGVHASAGQLVGEGPRALPMAASHCLQLQALSTLAALNAKENGVLQNVAAGSTSGHAAVHRQGFQMKGVAAAREDALRLGRWTGSGVGLSKRPALYGSSLERDGLALGRGMRHPERRRYAVAPQATLAESPSETAVPTKVEERSDAPTEVHMPLKGKKPRVVILGSGWGACKVMRSIDPRLFDLVVVSPRNHMVFTPLLASTAVGTLEHRAAAIPVRSIQPALNTVSDDNCYFCASCTSVDTANRIVHCASTTRSDHKPFSVAYDKLVIAVGSSANTFGIKGVHEHAIFLREIDDAKRIRQQLIRNLMKANIPGTSDAEKEQLLSILVVGGGPTGVEFSGELSDFLRRDVHSKFPNLEKYIKVTLVEGHDILSSFDTRLREYAVRALTDEGVILRKGRVQEVLSDTQVGLNDGTTLPYGILVWSTGVAATPFAESLPFDKARGRIKVDDRLRVLGVEDVYALGDCAAGQDQALPTLAQVAERQGGYLSKRLNTMARNGAAWAGKRELEDTLQIKPFVYKQLGSMATVGGQRGLLDIRNADKKGFSMAGFLSFLAWRSAYLSQVVTWRSRFYVLSNWMTTLFFGRDTSTF